ncbi:MAG: hypothetical protein IPK60_25055 [Sandaracinaceae bacterium]|jgi:hypothetical protein|nr:hypothetical protein [Sandaracinaceae bacterium]
MLRISLMFMLALGTVGCAADVGESVDDASEDTDDPAGKEDGVVRPVGTFEVDNVAGTQGLYLVTLMSDKTFHYEKRDRVVCVRAPCPARIAARDGTYTYTKSGRSRYIRFLDEDRELIARYRYTFSATSGVLRMTKIDDGAAGATVSLTRDEAGGWCETSAQCTTQELPLFRCLGAHWECSEDNACVPGTCSQSGL